MSMDCESPYQYFPQELICAPGPVPWKARTGWLQTSDGAMLFYADTGGKGQPLVLAHGWTMSSQVWRKNVPELSKHFRVVTFDLRGHGSSSKVLQGHTLVRYALDLRELVAHLDLARPVLAGWSLGGGVVMEYWRQFGNVASVQALALLDSSIGPFADGDWNAHRMKEGKMDAMNAAFKQLWSDPAGYARQFISGLCSTPPSPDDAAWMLDEIAKTPPWVSSAILSDFGMHNYEPLLAGVTVPAAVFSGVFHTEKTLDMGKHFAERLPKGRYFPHPKAGHMFFYEEAEQFNRELAAFALDAQEQGRGLVNPMQ